VFSLANPFSCSCHHDKWQETLFDGYPSIDELTRKLNRLLGVTGIKDAPRDPPWVSVCLKSYYVSKTDVWGSRNFKIFGIKIVGDT